MATRRLRMKVMELDVDCVVVDLPPDTDIGDLPCVYCHTVKPNFVYVLDVCQYGFLDDHVVTVAKCSKCGAVRGFDYHIEYGNLGENAHITSK